MRLLQMWFGNPDTIQESLWVKSVVRQVSYANPQKEGSGPVQGVGLQDGL